MKTFRGMAAALASVALIGLTACGGGDGDDNDVASSNTTQAVSQTTAASSRTTAAAAVHASPCLSNEEVAALTGTPPESATSREHVAKKWPNGDCVYEWKSINVSFRVSLEFRSDTAEYFEERNQSSEDDKYSETMTPPAIGDKAFLNRSTGIPSKTGINGIMRVIRGPLFMSSNYTDYDNKLRPSLQDSVTLWTELMRAHLNKMPAAQP